MIRNTWNLFSDTIYNSYKYSSSIRRFCNSRFACHSVGISKICTVKFRRLLFCCLLIIYSHETGFNFQLLNCCVCVLLLNHLYPVICVSVFFFYSLFIITSTCRKNHFSVWEVKEYLVCNEVIITWPLLHAVPSCHFRYYYHHHFF